MPDVDAICQLCGSAFRKRVGVPGRPQIYCSKKCRKRVFRLRAGLQLVDVDKLEAWDGTGYEPWVPADAPGG